MLFAFDSESELKTSPSDWLVDRDAMAMEEKFFKAGTST